MATAINAIYRGSVTYLAADGTAPAAISLGGTIVTGNSIVSMTTRSSDFDNRIQRHFFQYDLTTTTIAFSRTEATFAHSVTIEWEVIEFSSGVTVQRGNESFGIAAATHDITITAVTSAQSFATITAVKPAGGNGWGISSTVPQHHYVDLTTTTNLKVTATTTPGAAADSWVDSWQVIEFDVDTTIQRGLSTSTGGVSQYSRTVTISAVTLARAFPLHAGMVPPSSTIGREQQTVSLNSTTQLQISSLNFGTLIDNTTSWVVVDLPSGGNVESGSTSILDTAIIPTTQPNWTTALINGSSLMGFYYSNVRQTNGATSQYDDFMIAVSLDSPADSLTLQRDGVNNDQTIEWFAIDWPAAAGGGRIMSSLAGSGGLAYHGGLAGKGGGLAG